MDRRRSSAAAALNPQEKAQLKEKLALLKREYSKTFHRLQRAERAEKAKNYVKKSFAEESLLLTQEEAENDLAESINQASEQVSVDTGSEAWATKAASAIFKPEAFSPGDGVLENLGTMLPTPEHKRTIFSSLGSGSEKKQNLLSKSRTTPQQKITLTVVEEPVCDVIQKNAECLSSCTTSGVEGSRSPVFKRNSFWETDHPIPKASFLDHSDGRHGNESPIAMLQPRCSQEMTEEATVPSSGCFREENSVPVSESSAAKRVMFQDATSKEMAEDPGRAADIASSMSLQGRAAIHEHKMEMRKGGNQCEVAQNVDLSNADSINKKSSGQGLGELSRPEPSLSEKVPAASKDSLLNSCTVVEGLPFPVEYYVRTTRRMSTCQREVNLAAVIQSQLGKKAKGRRVSQKKTADPALSCQGLAVAPGTSPNTDGDVGSVATSPGPLPLTSEGTASDNGLPCNSGLLPRRKGRPRGKPKRSHASSGKLKAPLKNLELTVSKASTCLVSGEAQVYDETELQTGQSSGGVNLEAEPAASFVGGPEENHGQHCSETGHENHVRNEWIQLDEASLLLPEPSLASLEWRERGTLQGSKQGHPLVGSQDPMSLGLPGTQLTASALPFHVRMKETGSLKGLLSQLGHKEFHLSQDGFGALESEELRARKPGQVLETFDPGKLTESFKSACLKEGAAPGEILREEEATALPPLAQRDLFSSKVFLSPAQEGLSSVAESQHLTPVFPLVGATPESQALLQSKVLPEAFCPSSLEGKADPGAEQEDLANVSTLLSSDLQEELCSTAMLQSQGQDGMNWKSEMDVGSPAERQMSPGRSVEHNKESTEQDEMMGEDEAEVKGDGRRKGSLKVTAKLKSFSGSCSVDASTVWWETAGCKKLCILTACETSVTLWRQLDSGQWGSWHTWLFAKVPVIQIVPLPDVCSLACVALGGLEIAEIQFLFHSSEDGSVKQSLIKAGDIKAVLGLRNRRLVSSCGSLKQQEVELVSCSGTGRSTEKKALMPPEETVTAFAEVDEMQEALVGMTVMNCVVIWNLKTGQLLQKMPVSCSFPASLCHKAYSDSGLLFVIVGHPHAKESKSRGNPAFQVFAFNPKTTRSTGVLFLSLPPGTAGRYLEGEVWGTAAAAVLTSGAIVVWDLFLGKCTALLPPSPEGGWSHVRWSITGSCLLAGRKDGSVYIYDYNDRSKLCLSDLPAGVAQAGFPVLEDLTSTGSVSLRN